MTIDGPEDVGKLKGKPSIWRTLGKEAAIGCRCSGLRWFKRHTLGEEIKELRRCKEEAAQAVQRLAEGLREVRRRWKTQDRWTFGRKDADKGRNRVEIGLNNVVKKVLSGWFVSPNT